MVLDLNLPKIGGFEVLREIRADPRTAAIPVLIVTASPSEADREQALSLGATGYLTKPVTRDALMQALVALRTT